MDTNKGASNNSRNSLLLRNANIIRPDQVLSDTRFLVKDGRIFSIDLLNEPEINADETLNLDGLRIFPGFIDLHIHGAVGVDTMTASKDGLDRVSQFLAAKGVIAWLPTLVPAPINDYKKAVGAIEALMRDQSEQDLPRGARVLGVHYEGPFVNSAQCGALHSAYFKSFGSVADIEVLPTPDVPNAVRMMTLAPEIDGGIELIRTLVDRKWIISLGHTRAGIDQLEMAFDAGARHMTHFMNAMPPFHHRAPGPVGWGLTKDAVTFDVIADGIHMDPLVLQLLLRTKGADSMALISDAIAAAGAGDGDYQIWGETISVKDGRTSNAHGTIAGSVITMLDAVRIMRSLGVSDLEIAKMASTTPARLLGLEHVGSIEVGQYADLVALDRQGNVRLTMISGRSVFTQDI